MNILSAAILAALATQVSSGTEQAASSKDAAPGFSPVVYSGRAGNTEVGLPRTDDPEISVDGRLDEAAWQDAVLLGEFTQYEPVEGRAATQDTEILVLYSADAIYFGVRALDNEPDLILARMGQRDRSVFNDDWVRIMLDTFNDQRQAYVFYVNPLGIQTDGLWIEGLQRRRGGGGGGGVSIDFNPDFIWESDGRVTDQGWVAEIKIPYLSLRFRNTPVQDWGINVTREVKRTRFKQAWAPLTKNVSSTLAQSGRLVGLQNLKPRRLVEINPVATGSRTGEIVSDQFTHDSFRPDFGVNARVGVTQNLILDAAVNPDFSQVEADANQISVNERFALFFPEKRPFFLEGTEIFRTPRNLVHTRQIADPSGGAKLTGKVGSFSVGYLGAVDASPRTFDGGDSVAVFNLLRVRRDIGRGSNVGFLYTDRTLTGQGGYNRVAAADARFLLSGRYTWTTQVAGSWTSDGLGASTGVQPLVMTSFERSGRNFGFQVKFDDVDPGFETQSGFIPRIGDTEVSGRIQTTRFGKPGAFLERISANISFEGFFDHDEFWEGSTPFEWELQAMPTLSFRGGRSLTFLVRTGYFRFQPESYDDFQVLGSDGSAQPFQIPQPLTRLMAVGMFPRMRVNNQVQLNGRFFYREVPIFREAARGLELQAAPEITLNPTDAVQLSAQHTFSRIWRQRDDSKYSTVNISRLRTQYQFSKALFVRAIVQYNLQERAPLRDPTTELPVLIDGSVDDGVDEGAFEGQFLLQYEPSPGTTFFIGYSRLMEGERSFRLRRMDPVADGLFVKLSYLFRM